MLAIWRSHLIKARRQRFTTHNKLEWNMRTWHRMYTHLRICFTVVSAFIHASAVIITETACSCKLCSEMIVHEKLWITVIIKLDWCHWMTTAGRCLFVFISDYWLTLRQCLHVYWVDSLASGNRTCLLCVLPAEPVGPRTEGWKKGESRLHGE